MEAILQNPFRILGIPANATEKQIQRNINVHKRFAEVGKKKKSDYDMIWMGDIKRDTENIQTAAKKIERPNNKIHHSLFWFINNTHVDQMAINYLSAGITDKAVEIWQKTINADDPEKKLISIINLSNLLITNSFSDSTLNKNYLREGLKLKGDFLKSEELTNYYSLISDERFTVNDDKLYKNFVSETIDSLKPYIKAGVLTAKEIIEMFDNHPEIIRKNVIGYFVDSQISNIENVINHTKKMRNDRAKKAFKYGKTLYTEAKPKIIYLKKLLGVDNIKFQMITNKLANEILQCSVDYFKSYVDSNADFDPGENALKLVKYANSLETTGEISDRIKKNIKNIKAWIDNKPQREKIKPVKEEIKFIDNKLITVDNKRRVRLDDASNLIDQCRPKLNKIRQELGSSDKIYLDRSSSVVGVAQSVVLLILNNLLKKMDLITTSRFDVKRIVREAGNIFDELNKFDLMDDFNETFKKNYEDIKKIRRQLNISSSTSQRSTSSNFKRNTSSSRNKTSSGGCYIATMVYGDFDSPKVMVFRKYRDTVLKKSILGRMFIRTYYFTSPKMVSILKDIKPINDIIRRILNSLARRLKK